jgi:hypothetical protein
MAVRTEEDFEADHQFEVEVLRIARLLYPGATGGSTNFAGQERDGVLIGHEVAVAIEATRSRKLDKAEKDGKKLKQLTDSLARTYATKAIRGFFITADEPTAAQRDAIKKQGGPLVSAMSFAAFRRGLFDASAYLEARGDYPFGSARDPLTNSTRIDSKYINLDLMQRPDLAASWNLDDICGALTRGSRFVLTGDYGVGKSMTLRQIWMKLRAEWQKDPTRPVPLHVNLRDHQGQEDPAEALHRHAGRIGFGDQAQLVRAWHSGQLTLLLDGFDEITFPGWTGRVAGLADVRRRNVALLRRFQLDSDSGTGIIIAGRSYFFDNDGEMQRSLGLPAGHIQISASDFTDTQISEYLRVNKLEAVVPSWMPSRPLLIGYLASLGMLRQNGLGQIDFPASGWDQLLDQICAREAQIDVGLDGSMIRRVIERLATRARRTTSGRGPLRFDDLNEAFREVCGYQPDEGSRVVLDRLPGLGVGNFQDDQSVGLPREFVDVDMVDAARAGDVFAFATAPRVPGIAGEDLRDWDFLLEDLGVDVVLHRLKASGHPVGQASAALAIAVREAKNSGLAADLMRVVLAGGGKIIKPAPILSEFVIPSLVIAVDADAGDSLLNDCIIQRLEFADGYSDEGVPRFVRCHFEVVEGATATTDLPAGRFEHCTFGTFSDSASNTNSILELRLSAYARVVLTILKKIYTQRGRGRKESALVRGLDSNLRSFVAPALAKLQSEDMVISAKSGKETIWLPVKASQRRALQLLASPMSTKDALLSD